MIMRMIRKQHMINRKLNTMFHEQNIHKYEMWTKYIDIHDLHNTQTIKNLKNIQKIQI